ncbi:MAG: PQQ-like beta-propeller repeat protein [Ignavibacteriales bacterium]|nr:PQQ-like beta-propeller repeat protein [Ignavibacteriales bacterium]
MKCIRIFTMLQLFFLIILSDLLFAQEPDTLWTRQYGGDSIDVAYDVEELWDGGFVVVGYTKSAITLLTGYDVWLIRTDSNGNVLWSRTYGGNGDEYGYSIKKTEDYGFIIAGTTNSFGAGQFDFYVIRTDSLGDTLWTRTFGGVNDDYGWSVDKTSDGGFVIAGEKDGWPIDADIWIIKTDSSGNIVWEKSYGNNIDDERAFSIKKTTDGGFIVAGAQGCNGYASCEGWLLRVDEVGDTIWSKIFMGNLSDWFQSVSQTSDDGYIIAGYLSLGSVPDLWLLRIDSSGNELWSKDIDYENDTDIGYSVIQTSDGGYIIAGQTHPFDGGSLSWVVRTDSSGNVLWDKTFPYEFPKNPTEYEDGLLSVKQTMDGGYIVAGYQSGDYKLQVFLVRIASDIIPVELTTFTANVTRNSVSLNWQTATETNNSGFEMQRSQMSNINGQTDWQVIGFVPGFGTTTEPKSYSFTDENLSSGKYQYRLKQIDFDGTFEYSNTVEVEINPPTEFSLEQNYPNPFNPTTKIKYTIPSVTLSLSKGDILVSLKVFDVLGNQIATLVNEQQLPGTYEVEFNVGTGLALSAASGVYYYQLRVYSVSGAGGFVETKKMILLR